MALRGEFRVPTLRQVLSCPSHAAHIHRCRSSRRQGGAAQRVSVSPTLPARKASVPQSKTGIDQVLNHRAAVSRFSPRLRSAPAMPLHLCRNPCATQRSLAHCAAAPVLASCSRPCARHACRLSCRSEAGCLGAKACGGQGLREELRCQIQGCLSLASASVV